MIKTIPIYNEKGDITNLRDVVKEFKEIALKRNIKLDLENPVTIQDKLSYLELFDRSKTRTNCADKYLLHDYCKLVLGKDICTPVIDVFDCVDDLDFNKLPNKCVVKCNHGYNMNIIVRDKSKLNIQECREKLRNWMNVDFSINSLIHAPHYHFIKHKIIVEELLEDQKQQSSLYDYKFWCFNGIPKMYTINTGMGHGDIMYYSMNDQELDLYGKGDTIQEKFEKPHNFDLMKEYACKLSKEFQFVRVDFYEVNNKVYLGELTFNPGACLFRYVRPEYNILVGNMLNLEKIA